MLGLGDPFTFPMDLFLERINDEHPGMAVVGGMSSSVSAPGQAQLIVNSQCVNHGGVCVHRDNVYGCDGRFTRMPTDW
ncbi:MAG: FIST N-terminal domain-containing protein [Pirellulaceae bacterium]